MHFASLTVLLLAVAAANATRDWSSTTLVSSSTTELYDYGGVTATGPPPMLAETNPVYFDDQETFQPNDLLQTSQPIEGSEGRNIFHLMGNLSPYFAPEEGFGVDEYPLPNGANISQVHLLHRHGSRYPTGGEPLESIVGSLSFLNNYSLKLGVNSLVPKGREELFESGVNSSKLLVRSTTVERVVKSTQNFLAGFFGLDWQEHAEILQLVAADGFNSSLTASYICKNGARLATSPGIDAANEWRNIYLDKKTKMLSNWAGGFNWTVSDTANAQNLCPYETVALGYSPFCELFDYDEWEGFSYTMSIIMSSIVGFGSPISRATGIGWVEEFLARVNGHLLDIPAGLTSANLTLDRDPATFPLSQPLFFDFAHDVTILSVLSAFGITQFADILPASGPPADQQFHTDSITPFAARLNIEIIDAPHEVTGERSYKLEDNDDYIPATGRTRYVHFLLNQRTVPLHASFKECEQRDDGWCELETFLQIQKRSLGKAQFQYSCNGDWDMGPYGSVTNGVPAQ
ncbi:histidine phosphatase superfamily [Aspergillus keveii]|uniref:3-phytase n=1 Tax=Aspergillus keveii TaxID=714993 RepID=A0ABR4FTR7_9EURO